MDFAASSALRSAPEVSDGQQPLRERGDLLSRLFALINMKLEDAAGIAADCSGRRPRDELQQDAKKLETLIAEAGTTVAAALALLEDDQ